MQFESANLATPQLQNLAQRGNSGAAPPATHTVDQGDTLYALSRRYGVDLGAMIRANPQLGNPDVIYPGDSLSIPAGRQVQVQPGDTLPTLAARHGTTPDALVSANRIENANNLFPGDILRIAGSADEGLASAQRGGSTPVESSTASGTEFAPTTDSSELVAGASGPAVSELQTSLQALGYYDGAIGGNFGPKTEAAVRAFQRDSGLAVDGWAGPQTLAALGAEPASRSQDAGPVAAPETPTVESGARADRVEAAIDYGMSVIGAPYGGATRFRFGDIPWEGGAHVSGTTGTVYDFEDGTQVFDCSGLVVSMFKRAGVDMSDSGMGLTSSRSVVNNANGHLENISRDQLQRGDLVAYPGHIAIYLGDGQILEAAPPAVKISSADKMLSKPDVVFRRVPL